MQTPAEHVAVAGHTFAQVPQWFGSVMKFTHAPLHVFGAAAGHAHWPDVHVAPIGQV
jgi:hypothetical protein